MSATFSESLKQRMAAVVLLTTLREPGILQPKFENCMHRATWRPMGPSNYL